MLNAIDEFGGLDCLAVGFYDAGELLRLCGADLSVSSGPYYGQGC